MANSNRAALVLACVASTLLAVGPWPAISAQLPNADWTDFTGECLQPPSLERGTFLVLTTIEQALQVIERYETDRLGGSCSDEFKGAFVRLKWVLDMRNDICGPEAYERIRAFHLEFIHFYVPELTREQLVRLTNTKRANANSWLPNLSRGKPVGSSTQAGAAPTTPDEQAAYRTKPIPLALRQFFVNFAKQASGHCKRQLVDRLKSVMGDSALVSSQDFAVIDTQQREMRRMGFLYELTKAGKSSYARETKDDLNNLEMFDFERALPDELLRAAGGNQPGPQLKIGTTEVVLGDDGSKLYLQVPFDDRLRRIKEACRKRFMPIYMELFAPLIQLNNLGYIDRTHTKHEEEELESRDEFKRWPDIIQTCEVLKDIEIVHDASANRALTDLVLSQSSLIRQSKGAIGGHSSGGAIKVLSRDEAAKLTDPTNKEQVRPLYDPHETQVEHQSVYMRMWRVGYDEAKRKAKEFEDDIAKLVRRKTSVVRQLKEDLVYQLKTAIRNGKQQVVEQDETAMLGRVAAFVNRHQNLIRGFSIVLSIVVAVAVHGG
jgi:hypothetical protein